MKLWLKFFIVILVILFFGIFYYFSFLPKQCLDNECKIIKTCNLDSDCIISCDNNCVSEKSICPYSTRIGPYFIGGLKCGCLQNECTFAIPSAFN
jgi:hypothetical protein